LRPKAAKKKDWKKYEEKKNQKRTRTRGTPLYKKEGEFLSRSLCNLARREMRGGKGGSKGLGGTGGRPQG